MEELKFFQGALKLFLFGGDVFKNLKFVALKSNQFHFFALQHHLHHAVILFLHFLGTGADELQVRVFVEGVHVLLDFLDAGLQVRHERRRTLLLP
jgi:hypothetical protein